MLVTKFANKSKYYIHCLSMLKGKVVLANTVYDSLKNSIMHNSRQTVIQQNLKAAVKTILWDSKFCYMKISGAVTAFFQIHFLNQPPHLCPTLQLHKLKAVAL